MDRDHNHGHIVQIHLQHGLLSRKPLPAKSELRDEL